LNIFSQNYRKRNIPISRNALCFIYRNIQEEFEDTKGVIRIEERQTTQWPKEKGQKDKRINNDLQNTTPKTKDRAT
jgi:hypothetical protein